MLPSTPLKNLRRFVFLIFVIEFMDEWVFGVREAAVPFIRDDLHLSYVQLGLFITIPNLVSAGIEPILGIWGDVGKRRLLIIGGGIFYAGGLMLLVMSQHFLIALLAFVIVFPASGAFVSL